ncbi:hypothetical protein EDD86DRAFT_99857 [Gorgonomyces haynaldii]|nr:hypothetical protein EDD86DRAFT_99857 [Gorgonomyces haynaldii]
MRRTRRKQDEEEEEEIVRCVCGQEDADEGSTWIQCEDCSCWQHMDCMGLFRLPKGSYFCENCRPEGHPYFVMISNERQYSKRSRQRTSTSVPVEEEPKRKRKKKEPSISLEEMDERISNMSKFLAKTGMQWEQVDVWEDKEDASEYTTQQRFSRLMSAISRWHQPQS